LVEDNNDGNPVLWLGLGLSALLMGASALFCKRYRDNSERHKKASIALTERFVLEEEAKWVEQKQILLADQTLVERRALFGWIIQREELTFEKVIGRGAFGEVFRGTWRGQPCAIKNIFERDQNQRYSNPQRPVQRRQVQAGSPSSSSSSFAFSNTPFDTNPDYLAIRMDGSEYATMSKKEQSDIFTMQLSSSTGMGAMAARMLSNMELSVLMKLRHPRIVALLGAGEFVENDRVGVFLVMELVVGSDLRKRCLRSKGSIKAFPWPDRVSCAYDIAEGMAYIHSRGLLHRDLKSMNVLVDESGRCKIADLGLAQSNSVDAEDTKCPVLLSLKEGKAADVAANRLKGTAHFIAPEVFRSVTYSSKSDVYAMGIVMFELLGCRTPYKGRAKGAREIAALVCRGRRPAYRKEEAERATAGFSQLMVRCWDMNPDARPSFDEIFEQLGLMMQVQVRTN
jgi:serine/threonine protein kinase